MYIFSHVSDVRLDTALGCRHVFPFEVATGLAAGPQFSWLLVRQFRIRAVFKAYTKPLHMECFFGTDCEFC